MRVDAYDKWLIWQGGDHETLESSVHNCPNPPSALGGGGGTGVYGGLDYYAAISESLCGHRVAETDPGRVDTVIWWQWLYSIPASQSPAIDDTGANAYNGQPYSDLLFLAGTLSSIEVSGDLLGIATRSISVKEGTALFFRSLTLRQTTSF
jgi:hypothetical protein